MVTKITDLITSVTKKTTSERVISKLLFTKNAIIKDITAAIAPENHTNDPTILSVAPRLVILSTPQRLSMEYASNVEP